MSLLIALRWLLIHLLGRVWTLLAVRTALARRIINAGFTIPPPFWFGYYDTLIRRASDAIDEYSTLTHKDKACFDLFILEQDDVYFLDTCRFLSWMQPTPAVVWRYWHAKKREPKFGLLHTLYHQQTLYRDVKFKPTHIRWHRVKTSVLGSHNRVDSIVRIESSVLDTRILSFLQVTPTFGHLIKERCAISHAIADQMVDCTGFMCWLKDFFVTFVKSPADLDEARRAYFAHPTNQEYMLVFKDATTNANERVAIGHAIQLLNVNRTWRGSLRMADAPVFHYAMKLFDDLYISKCGQWGGVCVGTLAQTMGLYGMEAAAMRFLRVINDDLNSNKTIELTMDDE